MTLQTTTTATDDATLYHKRDR